MRFGSARTVCQLPHRNKLRGSYHLQRGLPLVGLVEAFLFEDLPGVYGLVLRPVIDGTRCEPHRGAPMQIIF